MAKIELCYDFNCQYNKDSKCTLEYVNLIVQENELYCVPVEDDEN